MPNKWAPETKAEALRIWVADGPSAASRATGVPSGTIRRWTVEEDLQPIRAALVAAQTVEGEADRQEAHKAWISAARMRQELKRVEIRELLWDRALEILHRMDDERVVHVTDNGDVISVLPSGADLKHLAIAVGVLIDKGRLEEGEVTDRTETISLTDVEVAIRKLEAELAGSQ